MRELCTLWAHELKKELKNYSTYIIGGLFTTFMGMLYFLILIEYTNNSYDKSPLYSFLENFWLPAITIIPLLTMKSFSEELKSGTLESLLATKTGIVEVVLGKFLSALCLYILFWSVALIPHFVAANFFVKQNLIFAQNENFYGGVMFLILSGGTFISIGILTSTLTKNQFLSGFLSFFAILAILVGSKLSGFYLNLQPAQESFLNLFEHFREFSEGIINLHVIVFHVSLTILFLGLASFWLEVKNFR